MKITNEIAELICNLEFLIGSECYNPNSYDGWTGDEGRDFRYPVYIYPNEDADDPIKIKGNVASSPTYKSYDGKLNEDNIRSMKYKFGSNHLFIGTGLINVLNYLEEKYDIDFNELEKKQRK